MSPKPARPRSTIEAWRAQQADVVEPWRLHLFDALERRSAQHTGATRQWLDARLSHLMDRYAEDLKGLTDHAEKPASASAPSSPARGPLGELVDQLAAHAQRPDEPGRQDEGAATTSAAPDLPALDDFRKTWSRLRSRSQLRQVREKAPADAGPLNSATLVHRSMTLMRTLSPDYLAHFLAYIDDLSWMEQLAGRTSSTPAAARSGSAKKRARSKSRPGSGD